MSIATERRTERESDDAAARSPMSWKPGLRLFGFDGGREIVAVRIRRKSEAKQIAKNVGGVCYLESARTWGVWRTIAAADEYPVNFTLNREPAAKPAQAKFSDVSARQTKLLSGLDCLPGQQDLFATDG